jgi:hypothetical protein
MWFITDKNLLLTYYLIICVALKSDRLNGTKLGVTYYVCTHKYVLFITFHNHTVCHSTEGHNKPHPSRIFHTHPSHIHFDCDSEGSIYLWNINIRLKIYIIKIQKAKI